MTSPDEASSSSDTPAPAVERQIVRDMVRRSLPVLPVIVLLSGVIWGVDGALSAAFAVGLVIVNFFLSAALVSWAARISPVFLMATALGGFLVRLGLVGGAILLVKDQSWVELAPLAITVLGTHLGLLLWETRHVSATLAFPALLRRNA